MSTSAGTPPEPSNGPPPAQPASGRDLRDSLWGKVVILVALLAFTLLVSKTCGSGRDNISQEEAVELAIAEASFEPCAREVCRQVRFLNQGIPPVGYWGVVLSEEVDENLRPNRTESFLVNASTGAVTKQ